MNNKINFWDIAKEFCKINNFRVITNFPGSDSSKIIENNQNQKYGISLNEKIAYEISYGSSLSNSRSVVSIKNVGLNVASDSYLNSILTGIKKAMLIFIVDDVWVFSSQSLQDSRYFLDFYDSPCIEPKNIEEIVQILSDATVLSEKSKMPIIIRLTNNFLNQKTTKKIFTSISQIKNSSNQIFKKELFLTHPKNSKLQRKYLEKRVEIIKKNNNESLLNYFNTDLKNSKDLDILFGSSNSKSNNDKLIIQTYPIPLKKIKEKIQKYNTINVYEQGRAYGFEKLKGNFNIKIKSHVSKIPDNSERIFFTSRYDKIFSKIKLLKEKQIFGDLNFFSNENTKIYDSILCLGSSIASAIGSSLSGKKNVFAILGDGGLRHSAIIALREAISKNININIIIIDNGGSKSTGMQKFSISVEDILQGLEYIKSDFQDLSSEKVDEILINMINNKKTNIWLIKDKEELND
jgi:TPP-dependent indolepyruvate ferredoxin oxidoreductase alpha subunit